MLLDRPECGRDDTLAKRAGGRNIEQIATLGSESYNIIVRDDKMVASSGDEGARLNERTDSIVVVGQTNLVDKVEIETLPAFLEGTAGRGGAGPRGPVVNEADFGGVAVARDGGRVARDGRQLGEGQGVEVAEGVACGEDEKERECERETREEHAALVVRSWRE